MTASQTARWSACLLLGWLLIPNAFAVTDKLRLPTGFQISVFSDRAPNARQMALGDAGTIFVGSRSAGNVYALIDENNDFVADKTIIVATQLLMPSGLAFKNKSLYVAAVNRILRYPNIESRLNDSITPELVTDALPSARHHGWKFIRFGADEKLYVPVGVPCNICESKDKRYGTILNFDLQTKQWSLVAKGVRNSVGFDWHPVSGELWFSENGRDNIGDDIPPDEINRISKAGQHFGFPYVYGDNIPQPEFEGHTSRDYEVPALNLQAHVAPLGIHFYRGKQFPKKYHGALFIAEHGSWNRSKKVGYRVMVAHIENNEVVSYEPFIEGWLQGQSVSGRPVAMLELADGSLLISDDQAGVVYRVSYHQ